MKILIINYRYFISGGPEKYMFNIMEKFQEMGHAVIPFSVKSNKNMKTEYERYFAKPIGNKDTVYYHEYKKTPKVIIQLLSRSFYSFQTKRAVKKIIKETEPDIVYILCYLNKLSPSVISGAKETGKKVIIRLSEFGLICPESHFLYKSNVCEDCLKKGLYCCILKKCVKNSLFASIVRTLSLQFHNMIHIYDNVDAMVTPSLILKEKLMEKGFDRNKIYHIPTFTKNSNDSNQKIGDYGLYFGRISEEKGVLYLVKAYEILGNDYTLFITGDDTTDEALKLKEYINNNHINNIFFSGFKYGDELTNIIRNCKYVLVPSIWYDNLPNTVLEAFSNYKPVIASDIGSLSELIQDGLNGYKFKPKDVNEIIDCIKKMDSDKLVMSMGKYAKSQIDDIYSPDKHYEKLMELFMNS